MLKKTSMILLLCAALPTCHALAKRSHRAPDPEPRALSKSELLALVAGESLPENIAYEIRTYGLLFGPSDNYQALLKKAGATPKVFAALKDPRITETTNPDLPDDSPLLLHLSNAGRLIRDHQLGAATSEVAAALHGDAGDGSSAFVMGDILIDQQNWQAAHNLYSEIFRRDPNFPEVHTRLSLAYYHTGEPEQAIRESKAALARNPHNPSAHLNAGISFQALHNFDAAKSEIQLALRDKPDFQIAYYDLGILLDSLRDYDGAIAHYKQSATLKPDDPYSRWAMGRAYQNKGDLVSAVREYREAKRLDPQNLDVRENLGSVLVQLDPASAITEFRELAAIAPRYSLCHVCLGNALAATGRLEDALDEYHMAAKFNPASPEPFLGIGRAQETLKNYDEALSSYRTAAKLDHDSASAYSGAGRVLLAKKDFPDAIAALKHAAELDPTTWTIPTSLAQALDASGDHDAAIAEYEEALSLDAQQLEPRLDLALALEKKGQWVAALDNYRRAAIDEPPMKIGVPQIRYDSQEKYRAAKERFQQHLNDLRGAGKSSEAATLAAALKARDAAPDFDQQFHAAIQASSEAVNERRFDDAETSAKQAIAIAEKIQPQDVRLPEAVGQLGNVYAWRLDYKQAEATYKWQLTLSEKLYAPDSPMLTGVLQNLAMTAVAKKDLPTALALFSRSLDLNIKAYGENSVGTTQCLNNLAHVYAMQNDFAKAEAAMLRVVKIDETIYGAADNRMALALTPLCNLYDHSNQPEKSAACHARLVLVTERQFGVDSPYLVRDLTAEAQALRQIGRNEEASQIERRMQSLQSAQENPN